MKEKTKKQLKELTIRFFSTGIGFILGLFAMLIIFSFLFPDLFNSECALK